MSEQRFFRCKVEKTLLKDLCRQDLPIKNYDIEANFIKAIENFDYKVKICVLHTFHRVPQFVYV